ncbi:MAG: hypothetical protein GY838_15195 [bacterium]|nr:hypothetical protein [bacterium]
MQKRTHAWIAIRALALLEEEGETDGLVSILKPRVRESAVGCWLPDDAYFKKGHGLTANHTFKIEPLQNDPAGRFILKRDDLLDHLDANTALHGFLAGPETENVLTDAWWSASYKADQPNGSHLADVLSSLYDTLMDLMLLGNEDVAALVPGEPGFHAYLRPSVTMGRGQITTFFLMMSHYVADCFMPCHCDGRKLGSFNDDIDDVHHDWEWHWDRDITGTYFDKPKLSVCEDGPTAIMARAVSIDEKLDLQFPAAVAIERNDDIWEQAIHWCRASFALMSHLFPPADYPYDGDDTPSFTELFDAERQKKYDAIILQSAVYTVASIWKKVWLKFG